MPVSSAMPVLSEVEGDGRLTVVQVLHLGNVARQSLPSLDAGFRHPCRNDGVFSLG
jgi:hypothetical protein